MEKLGQKAFKYVKAQLNNSLRVKKPSDEFVTDYAQDFMNFQLIGYFYGIKTVRDRVELDKKIYSFAESNNFGFEKCFEFFNTMFLNQYQNELDPKKFVISETVQKFAEGIGIAEKEIRKLVKLGKEKAQNVAKLIYYDSITQLNEIFKKTKESGETIRQWTERIGDNELMKKIGLHKENPYRLETIFRTNSTSAYNAGKYEESIRNKEIAYFTFIAIDDSRTTEQCSAYNNVTRPKTDVVWTIATPPLHFQCRSSLVEYTQIYVKAVGIKETKNLPDSNIIPVDFRNNPATNNDWLKTSKTMEKRIKEYEKAS